VEQESDLVFFESPRVEFASNFFERVPVILQYDETPILEVVNTENAGFTTQFSIFHKDGTYLAKVKGSRLFLTDDGQKAKLRLRYPAGLTVCELDGRTLFEVRRKEAAALKAEAELFTPDGSFLKCSDEGLMGQIVRPGQEGLKIGGVTIKGMGFADCRIGIRVSSMGGRVGMG
jgi:hypothetical protein